MVVFVCRSCVVLRCVVVFAFWRKMGLQKGGKDILFGQDERIPARADIWELVGQHEIIVRYDISCRRALNRIP